MPRNVTPFTWTLDNRIRSHLISRLLDACCRKPIHPPNITGGTVHVRWINVLLSRYGSFPINTSGQSIGVNLVYQATRQISFIRGTLVSSAGNSFHCQYIVFEDYMFVIVCACQVLYARVSRSKSYFLRLPFSFLELRSEGDVSRPTMGVTVKTHIVTRIV
jgi:hypothetical protein